MDAGKKSLFRMLDNDIFEIYYKSKSIDFIIDIKEHLNNNGFKILDKNNNSEMTEDFYKLLENNLICIEQQKTNEIQQESDDEEYNYEL